MSSHVVSIYCCHFSNTSYRYAWYVPATFTQYALHPSPTAKLHEFRGGASDSSDASDRNGLSQAEAAPTRFAFAHRTRGPAGPSKLQRLNERGEARLAGFPPRCHPAHPPST